MILILLLAVAQAQTYTFPQEWQLHKATWIQWPNQYQYGKEYSDKLDPIWVDMARELSSSEQVNIVVYNQQQRTRVSRLNAGIPNIKYYVYPTDDVWARDNGPIFVFDSNKKLYIEDWGFNGWGRKANYANCDQVPTKVARDLNLPLLNLNKVMINEGGSVETDGHGVMMGCKSSILNANRNPGMSQAQAQTIFKKYYGVSKFIWLDGVAGKDITDMHIDGFARFGPQNILITMNTADLEYWQVPQSDITKLQQAKNAQGYAYRRIEIPLTKNDVMSSSGKNLGRASYINYYIANTKVLVPNYDDQNDSVANELIQEIFPERTVVGIWVNDLFENGGMIHCVTQQQPVGK